MTDKEYQGVINATIYLLPYLVPLIIDKDNDYSPRSKHYMWLQIAGLLETRNVIQKGSNQRIWVHRIGLLETWDIIK